MSQQKVSVLNELTVQKKIQSHLPHKLKVEIAQDGKEI